MPSDVLFDLDPLARLGRLLADHQPLSDDDTRLLLDILAPHQKLPEMWDDTDNPGQLPWMNEMYARNIFAAILGDDRPYFRTMVPRHAYHSASWNSSGLTPLHLAILLNRLEITKILLEREYRLSADPLGRMPSILAIEAGCSDELIDLVVEAEAAAGV